MSRVLVILLGALLATAAPSLPPSAPGAERREPRAASRLLPLPIGNRRAVELPGLHNVFRLSQKLYSGGVPEGDAGFRSLRRLGVRTVLSVDGARPDGERARRFGMRYVHIPFGYDGCPDPTAARIVRAVRDLPGPIYLHCHHGKHRSPAAAAFARIALDGLANEAAVREMERAGTGKAYVGLYGDVRRYRPPSRVEIDRVPPEFPEIAPTPPLMEAMVRIDQRFEALQRCRTAGWRTPPGHPDLQPAHEALQLREQFTELERTPEGRAKPADYRGWMQAAARDARALEATLRARERARASLLLDRLGTTCAACHTKYRNVPQGGEKGASPSRPRRYAYWMIAAHASPQRMTVTTSGRSARSSLAGLPPTLRR